MDDDEALSDMLADLQVSIKEKKKRLAEVNEEIEEQKLRKELLEQEVSEKEREMDYKKQDIQKLKEKHTVICTTLYAKRRIFDLNLRQMHQSSEIHGKEPRVSALCTITLYLQVDGNCIYYVDC